MRLSKPKIYGTVSPARLFAAAVAALCCAAALSVIETKAPFASLWFLFEMDVIPFAITGAAVFVLLVLLDIFTPWRQILPAVLFISITQYAILLVSEHANNIWFNVGLALVLYLAAGWILREHRDFAGRIRIGYRTALAAGVLLFLLFTFIVGYFTVVRHMAYGASNFDFGIFAQMFDNMKDGGLPITTVERNRVLSHFAVHFSPALYLLLPGYMLFSCPEYLLIAQAAVVGSGVFAVYAIAKHMGFTPKETVLLQVLYLALPSLVGGSMYDFHENCMLAPLVLWLLYFVLRQMPLPTFGFAMLVVAVKEDAAIYVIAAALFMLLYQKRYLFGSLLLAFALAYFFLANTCVAWFGGEVMIDRLANYFEPGSEAGFLQVVRTVLLDVGYLFSEVFNEKKVAFLIWVFLPLLFAPLMGRRHAALTLLLPLLVVNVMPDYPYQYDIAFQYTFGVMGMVLVCGMLVLRERGREMRRTTLLAGAAIALVMTVSLNMPLMRTYWRIYDQNAATFAATTACLQRLPRDAEIMAGTYLIAHLDEWDTVYMFDSVNQPHTEYAVLDTRGDNAIFKEYMGDAYVLIDSGGYCEVYRLKG